MLCRALPLLFEVDDGLALVMDRLELFKTLTNKDCGIIYHNLKDMSKGCRPSFGLPAY